MAEVVRRNSGGYKVLSLASEGIFCKAALDCKWPKEESSVFVCLFVQLPGGIFLVKSVNSTYTSSSLLGALRPYMLCKTFYIEQKIKLSSSPPPPPPQWKSLQTHSNFPLINTFIYRKVYK